tara:strand:- start:104 stop:1699 length:1596 start_codon:yes stop_codon:yes gene_type:complete
MQRQAERLANQGRYGDSMMVHMNPTEVQVLNQMAPGGLTRNPQTGQPEAFAFLAPLIASMASKAGILGTTGLLAKPVVAGALASGLTTTIQTGSLEEGIKSGLMSGLIGKVGGDLIKGLGDGVSGGTEQIVKETAPVVDSSIAQGGGADQFMTPSGITGVDVNNLPAQVNTNVADVVDPAMGPGGQTIYNPSGIDLSSPVASPKPDAGMFAGIGEAVGDMGIGDIATPMLQGAITSDAIAMYPGDGGDMEQEEEEDFYVAVEPGDRGMRMPEMGYDAGTGGEFDYFSNPFRAIPVAKTGGHVRQFQTGGKANDPIQLTGLRGFTDVTPPASFDFSGTDIYGPAPVNMDDFNLGTKPAETASADTGQSLFQQIAAKPGSRSPSFRDMNLKGLGIYNLGGVLPHRGSKMFGVPGMEGGLEDYLPEIFGPQAMAPDPTLTAFGGRFAPDPAPDTQTASMSAPTQSYNAMLMGMGGTQMRDPSAMYDGKGFFGLNPMAPSAPAPRRLGRQGVLERARQRQREEDRIFSESFTPFT